MGWPLVRISDDMNIKEAFMENSEGRRKAE